MTRIWNKHKQSNTPLKRKVFVAMSGGVDSSVAAKLLKDQGHDVVGIFLHFWQDDYKANLNFDLSAEAGAKVENKCCSAEALLDARRVADKIHIPLYTLNFAKIFKEQVVDNFLAEYAGGRTPNPCVKCNKLVKLGFLIKQAKKLGFNYVASGHYAKRSEVRSKKSELKYKLYQAKDKNKDQSYFLYTFNQNELKHLLFPLGNYTKVEVRQMAKRWKLPVAEKLESQEICFIQEKSHNEFLKRHLKLEPGPIKILNGQTVGAHQGLPLYTIGQRKGLKIGGAGPFYAAKMDYKTNSLLVVNDNRDKNIFKDQLIAGNVNWIAGQPPVALKGSAVIRYRHKAAKCQITKIAKNTLAVKFKKPQRAITPGQSVVFYRGGEVLGGGIIK